MGLPEVSATQTERLSAAFATWQQAQRDAVDAMLASSANALTVRVEESTDGSRCGVVVPACTPPRL